MNYVGTILGDQKTDKEIYDFLRKALMRGIEIGRPLRGPTKFSSGDWEYSFSTDSDTSFFKALELISFKGASVYKAHLHGGRIID